jgi:HAD superfamily hydrolase (TIGR01484 family)
MLPNKKIIAFDLDGTLTVSKSPITEEMAELVKKLAKQKMVVIISGGWLKQFELQFLPPFHDDDSMIPFIRNLTLLPTSGSQRYEFNEIKKEWELTDKEPLDEDTKKAAIKLLQEIIDSDQYGIPSNPIGNIIEDRDTQVTFTPNGQQAPIEIKKLWDPDRKKREKIKLMIGPQLSKADVLINGSSSIDIVPKGFNKAVGLTRLLNKLNLNKKDMIFVGDGLFPGGNDYSVFEAGIETIAVKGPEETKLVIKNWLKN